MDEADRVVLNGNDLLCFLDQFPFWDVTRQTAGRMVIVVRTEDGYERLHSRKGETVCQLAERLRQLIASQQEGE
jgi:hypothetical protein